MAAERESMRAREALLLVGPPAAVAVSVSGFWLYLGALELVGVEPRTSLTAAYYAALAVVLSAAAWIGRARLRSRTLEASRAARVWAATGVALAAWFVVNAALFSSGVVARDAVALLLLSSLPTALAALSLTRSQLRLLWPALTALGLALALVSAARIPLAAPDEPRFTPIDELDPISASRVFALAACLLLLWRPRRALHTAVQAVGAAVLVAAAIVPGSRGSLVALAAGLCAVSALSFRRLHPASVAAVVAGVALGVLGTTVVGSDYYYSLDVPGLEGRIPPPGTEFRESDVPISSLRIRLHLVEKALRDSADRPFLGHGVGMLVADGPDVMRMVRAGRIPPGQKTYPHNVVVEALYSLGVVGLALLLAFAGAAATVLARALRRGTAAAAPVLVFAALAGTNAMISGELGSDVALWAALALPLAVGVPRLANDELGV